MKKNYMCPDMEVVEIGFNHPLLEGSATLPNATYSQSPRLVLRGFF